MRAFFLSIFLLVIFSSVSYACSCGELRFEDKIQLADQIFYGRIIEATSYTVKNIDGNSYKEWSFTFDVVKKWKGDRKSRIKIYMEGTSCDFYFNIFNEEYLVYANKGATILSPELNPEDRSLLKRVNFFKNKHTTSLCTGTKSRYTHSGVITTDNFEHEFSDLDKEFPNAIILLPYYFNFTNLFLLIGVVLAGIYVGNRNLKQKSS